jgi:hypothetical protein
MLQANTDFAGMLDDSGIVGWHLPRNGATELTGATSS